LTLNSNGAAVKQHALASKPKQPFFAKHLRHPQVQALATLCEGSQPEHMQLAVRQGDVLSLLKANGAAFPFKENGLSSMRDALP
jgi:hypothetical protein